MTSVVTAIGQYYDLLLQPILQPIPPPPCTFTLTTVYKINCCIFVFNMSYSRLAL